MSGFYGAFATDVACQQGTLTTPDTWFRPPFLGGLHLLWLLRPVSLTLHRLNDLPKLTFTDWRGFHWAFATGVACQQGALTLPDTWFRPPLWDLLLLSLLRPDSSNLPCLYSTFHLEYSLVLSRFCLHTKELLFVILFTLVSNKFYLLNALCALYAGASCTDSSSEEQYKSPDVDNSHPSASACIGRLCNIGHVWQVFFYYHTTRTESLVTKLC